MRSCASGAAQTSAPAAHGRRRCADNNQPAGLLVEPMHDAGALVASDRRKRAIAMQQGVDQGAAFVPSRSGMNRHAGGFIDDGEIVVLIHKLQRNVFGKGSERGRRWIAEHLNGLATTKTVRSARRLAVHADFLLLDQELDAFATHSGQLAGEPCVQPLLRGLGRHRIGNRHCYEGSGLPGPVRPGGRGQIRLRRRRRRRCGGYPSRWTSQLRSSSGHVERGMMEPQSPQPWLAKS